MIVFASILGAILATSILALNPSTITNAQAIPYGSEYYDDRHSYGDQYGYDSNYYRDDNRYSYDKKDSKSYGDIQKISCVNSNINVNGIDITQIPQDSAGVAATNEGGAAEGANTQNGNGLDKINFDRNLVNICANVNSNDQLKVEPPETATLTIKKEIFGCESEGSSMECDTLADTSLDWLPCIGSTISNTPFCQNLPANLFDIEVLDDQNTQLQQFEGSAQGTTIQNLQPGTYTVNEIKHANIINQLGESDAEDECKSAGFEDAGLLLNTNANPDIGYQICFEYEDEQGNDCSTLTLQPGEDKTCIVKNHIRNASQASQAET
jgi:hypothetical protein